ncbi:MAG TPA: polyprenyl diphosphate synthase [Fimbriimonadaceae bacterium]|nr:polyprenyl diphosphate synthase [Fimbriimonadaceae bacterium]HRJ34052.1 polyprenyl diphosphate synthase [Fimbriimonadaceae bacterium]
MSTKVPAIRSQALERGVDLERFPAHVGVIMDGNGRWATGRGLQRLLGHREGYRTLRRVLLAASELGVRYLTVYAFSAENWRRPEDEVRGLLSLIEQAARDELRIMHQNNVRVQVAGRTDELPEGLRAALEHGIKTTAKNTGITFTLAINYGGRAEIVDAIQGIVREGIPASEITEELLSQRMYNPETPDPDLIVRTAGEMRWSNFLIWQAAYAELFVTEKPWPDFGGDDLIEAVLSYQVRTRKFGGV